MARHIVIRQEVNTGGLTPWRYLQDTGPPSWISEDAGTGSLGSHNWAVLDQ